MTTVTTLNIKVGESVYPVGITSDLMFEVTLGDQLIKAGSANTLRVEIENYQQKKRLKVNIPLVAKLNGRWQVILFRGFSGKTNNPLITNDRGEKEEVEYGLDFYPLELKSQINALNAHERHISELRHAIGEVNAEIANLIRTTPNADRISRHALQSRIQAVIDGKIEIEGVTVDE